jgi:hypothetical protein
VFLCEDAKSKGETGLMKIAAVCYGGGHVNCILPVLVALKKMDLDLVCLGLTTAKDKVAHAGIRTLGYDDLLQVADRASVSIIKDYGEKAIKKLVNANSSVSRAESIAYLGWNLLELTRRYTTDCAWDLYEDLGRSVFDPDEPIRLFLRTEAPDIIITSNSPRSERAALLIADELSIPSVCIVDFFPFLQDWIYYGHIKSQICVAHPIVRDMLIANGVPATRVHFTGNPDFDNVASSVCEFKRHNSECSREPGRLKNILYVSSPEGDRHVIKGYEDRSKTPNPTLMADTLFALRGFTESNQLTVSVRRHPSESLEVYESVLRELNSNWFQIQNPLSVSVPEALARADLVVTHCSTLGVIAALCGIPTIKVFGSMYDEDVPTHLLGIYVEQVSIAELESALDKIIAGDSDGFDRLIPIHPRATSRIIEVIATHLGPQISSQFNKICGQ